MDGASALERDSDEPPVTNGGRFRSALRWARTAVTTVVGFTLVASGVALVFLPGPGLLVVLFGLTVLAAEYVWARRLIKRARAMLPRPRHTPSAGCRAS